MNRRVVAMVLLSVLGLFPAGEAFAWVQSTSSKGALVHWKERCLAYSLYEDGSDDIDDGSDFYAIQRGVHTWNKVDCAGVEIDFAGETNYQATGFLQEDPVVNLIIFREKNWPYTQKPVAFTSVTYNPKTGEIVDADIEMNGEAFQFTTNPEEEFWKIDIENTITHEAGHILGLDHAEDSESTMYFRSEPGETRKRTLEEDDIDGLCTIYPLPGSTCTEVQPQFLNVDNPTPNSDDSGGCAVGSASSSMAMLLMLLAFLISTIWARRP